MQTQQTVTATCPHCHKPYTLEVTLGLEFGDALILGQTTPTYPLPKLPIGPRELKPIKPPYETKTDTTGEANE